MAHISTVLSIQLRSGSMAGQKLSIVKLAAMSLLDTLQENDFVNIIIVVSNLKIKYNTLKISIYS